MRRSGWLVALLGVICLAGPGSSAPLAGPPGHDLLRPPLWVDADDRDIPEPAGRDASEAFGIVYNSWLRHLDVGDLVLRSLDRPALNVNAWDEVPDSSWFTNRIGSAEESFTPGEMIKGPPGRDPEPGTWTITSLKTEGYTPGFQMRDAAGRRYFLKLDPETPERNSAAELIGSLIARAAGYNVPRYSVVDFDGDDLVVDDEAVFEDELGRERPMTPEDVAQALSRIPRRDDGRFRGSASLYVEGAVKGPFSWTGTREDDPNDIIPHELRRELRGLGVIASWFNHVDVKETNTLDTWVEQDGRRFLRHYLIDFGSSMGSGDFVNGPCRVGFEYIFDGAATGLSLVTLGVWQRPWEASCAIPYPEVGRFGSDLFDPAAWKPNYPNLAFQAMDAADGYWGAKIVTAFGDGHVRGLAAAADYTRPEVAVYVEEVLRRRRDRIGRYWLDQVTPLEAFELHRGAGSWTLRFRDLAVERGYVQEAGRRYRFEVRTLPGMELLEEGTSAGSGGIRLVAPVPMEGTPTSTTDRWGRTPLALVDIFSARRDGSPAAPVRLVIGLQRGEPGPRVLGWSHAPGSPG